MFFSSDNWAGAHPKIAASLSAHASGFEPAYGNGSLDAKVSAKFAEVFERDVAVFFVSTGTAANSLSLVAYNKPGGISFGHRESHIIEDECGAPEYLMGGSRLHGVDGPAGRMDPEKLNAAVERFVPLSVHSGRPAAISITQTTEVGTVYDLAQIDAIAATAKKHNLPLHMDGARFANALVSLKTTPAEMTWKRGVDVLSFGGTKNGCWCAEAVIMFDTARTADFPFIRKRAGQQFSKTRFIAAQFDAYFADDLWLETASHANAMAAMLASAIGSSSKVRLAWTPQANEVFAIMSTALMESLQGQGAHFYDWPLPHGFDGDLAGDEKLCRFVTSFATTQADIERFAGLIG